MSAASPSEPVAQHDRFLILVPNYNDWRSLELHIRNLDEVMKAHQIEADLLIVDDGSTIPAGEALGNTIYQSLRRVEILRLRRTSDTSGRSPSGWRTWRLTFRAGPWWSWTRMARTIPAMCLG